MATTDRDAALTRLREQITHATLDGRYRVDAQDLATVVVHADRLVAEVEQLREVAASTSAEMSLALAAEVDVLRASVSAVRALHEAQFRDLGQTQVCASCGSDTELVPWPCPTVQALGAAPEGIS